MIWHASSTVDLSLGYGDSKFEERSVACSTMHSINTAGAGFNMRKPRAIPKPYQANTHAHLFSPAKYYTHRTGNPGRTRIRSHLPAVKVFLTPFGDEYVVILAIAIWNT